MPISALLSAAGCSTCRSCSSASQLTLGFLRSHSLIKAPATEAPEVPSAAKVVVLPSHKVTSTPWVPGASSLSLGADAGAGASAGAGPASRGDVHPPALMATKNTAGRQGRFAREQNLESLVMASASSQ